MLRSGVTVRRLFTRGVKLDNPIMGDNSGRSWIQIARTGEFKGHASGPFELTLNDLKRMVANFEKDGDEIPIVLGHPDEETEAYGWIHDLEIRGQELWALAEWSPEIVPLIRAGKFRGCSMVFSTESIDRESGDPIGAELYELGITNRPFISGMEPISAHRRVSKELRLMMIDRKMVLEAMGELPKDASPEQYHLALEAVFMKQASMEKPEEPKAEEMPAQEMAAPVAASNDPVAVKAAESESVNAPEDASGAAKDQIVGALEKALGTDLTGVLAFVQENAEKLAALAKSEPASGTPADQPAEKAASHDAHAIRLSALEARLELAETRAKDYQVKLAEYEEKEKAAADGALIGLVDHAVENGHILPAHRETFLKLGRLDRSALTDELSKLSSTPAVITKKLVHEKPVGAAGETVFEDDVEKNIGRLLAHSPEKVRKAAIEIHRAKNKNNLSGRV